MPPLFLCTQLLCLKSYWSLPSEVMNFLRLSDIVHDKERSFNFLQQNGIAHTERRCDNNHEMTLQQYSRYSLCLVFVIWPYNKRHNRTHRTMIDSCEWECACGETVLKFVWWTLLKLLFWNHRPTLESLNWFLRQLRVLATSLIHRKFLSSILNTSFAITYFIIYVVVSYRFFPKWNRVNLRRQKISKLNRVN